jgi:7-cyano-7-deazaguanine synthase
MPGEKTVVLLSGGMDSAALLALAVKRGLRAHALTVDYGQRSARREIPAARSLARALDVPHRVLRVRAFREFGKGLSPLLDPKTAFRPWRPNYGDAYVPHRNLFLLSLACAHAESLGARRVLYGALRSDRDYWDASGSFFARLNRALALKPRAIRVETPLRRYGKPEVLRLGLRLGVPYELTYTCFTGGRRPCGRCAACRYRRHAWRLARRPDPALAR